MNEKERKRVKSFKNKETLITRVTIIIYCVFFHAKRKYCDVKEKRMVAFISQFSCNILHLRDLKFLLQDISRRFRS